MSRISTYPIDAVVDTGDLLIGTDSEDQNITKNYTIASIISLATSGGYINAAVGATTVTPIAEASTFYFLEGTLVTSVSKLWAVGTGVDVNKIIYSGTASQVTNIISTVNISGSMNTVINIALFKNDTEIAGTRQIIRIPSVAVPASVCLQTINTVLAGDVISVKVMTIASTDDVTATHYNISATLV
jgi:hypothetical protein